MVTVDEALIELHVAQAIGIAKCIEYWQAQGNPYAIQTVKLAKRLAKDWKQGKAKPPKYYETFLHALNIFAACKGIIYTSEKHVVLSAVEVITYLTKER